MGERVGISNKKLRILQTIYTLIQIPTGFFGLIAAIGGALDNEPALGAIGFFLFYGPLLLRALFPLRERFFEYDDKGITQGKKSIRWEDVVLVSWVKRKMSNESKKKKERGYFYFDAFDGTFIKVILTKEIAPETLIKIVESKKSLKKIKELPKDSTDMEYLRFRDLGTVKTTEWKALWRNETLHAKRKKIEDAPKSFPKNLYIMNWPLKTRRIVFGIYGLLLFAFIVFGYYSAFQGNMNVIPLWVIITASVSVILLIFFGAVSVSKSYWIAFLAVIGFLYVMSMPLVYRLIFLFS